MAAKELNSTPLISDASLVSYYRMEGNPNDTKGTNNGTNVSMTYSSTGGKFNQYGIFHLSSHIKIADSASLSFNSDFTLHLWAYFNALPASNDFMGLMVKAVSGARSYYVVLGNPGGTRVVYVGVSSDGSTDSTVNVAWTPSTGQWYMIDVVYEKSSGTATLYINGSQQGTPQVGLPTSIFDSTTQLTLGIWADESNYPLDGRLDDVAIFTRKLTSTEISDLFNGFPTGHSFATIIS